jgi:hypothetical protein
MALPIKPKDTQDSCNPVSSNCVIWQGPDIPCINLCNGDSVSDVVAKMAERLCTITDQLDISLLDLSCFNPIYPTPQDFQDVTQFILNRICSLENPSGDDPKASGDCPDNCIVTIAPCFQESDFLGNLITTLPLKDYVIKIGNEICTILSTITTLTNAIADLESRVTNIEDNCCTSGGGAIDITTIGCVGNGVTQPIQNFLSQFETAFCNLQEITAGQDLVDAQDTIQSLCLTGNEVQFSALFGNPSATTPTLSNISGWYPTISNTSQALNNLYLAFCDLRSYVEAVLPALVESVSACCGVTCADLAYSMTASNSGKFLRINFSGNIPAGFTYCSSPPTKVFVYHMGATPGYFTVGPDVPNPGDNDIIGAINSSSYLQYPTGIDMDNIQSNSQNSIFFSLEIQMCLTNGDITCSSVQRYEFYNPDVCSLLNAQMSSVAVSYTTGRLQVNWQQIVGIPSTTYSLQLYNGSGAPVSSPIVLPASAGSWQSSPLPGGDTYYATITVCQTGLNGIGPKCAPPCQTNYATVEVVPTPPAGP